LPDHPQIRQRRKDHINGLFTQLNNLWPDVDILIITQNWKDFVPSEVNNKVVRVNFEEKLGILKARQVLREEFLKLDYDYIIFMDDDCDKIKLDGDHAHLDYMTEIDKHPSGLCFICSENHWHHHDDMARGPLNLFALSKDLFEKEPFVEIDIEKFEGMEDDIYVEYLWHKYPEKRFIAPTTIHHTNSFKYMYVMHYAQYEIAPPTWFMNVGAVQFYKIWHNTNYVIECYEAGEFDLEKIKENKAKWQM